MSTLILVAVLVTLFTLIQAERPSSIVTGLALLVVGLGGGWPFEMFLDGPSGVNAEMVDRIFGVWGSDATRLIVASLAIVISLAVQVQRQRGRRRRTASRR